MARGCVYHVPGPLSRDLLTCTTPRVLCLLLLGLRKQRLTIIKNGNYPGEQGPLFSKGRVALPDADGSADREPSS